MMINSEQAFDMLPYVVDLYEKTDFDHFRKTLNKKYKGKKTDSVEVAIDAVKYILRNSSKVKNEFFHIVSIAENKPVKEVKEQSLVKTIGSMKAIFSDPELMSFFKEAM